MISSHHNVISSHHIRYICWQDVGGFNFKLYFLLPLFWYFECSCSWFQRQWWTPYSSTFKIILTFSTKISFCIIDGTRMIKQISPSKLYSHHASVPFINVPIDTWKDYIDCCMYHSHQTSAVKPTQMLENGSRPIPKHNKFISVFCFLFLTISLSDAITAKWSQQIIDFIWLDLNLFVVVIPQFYTCLAN